MADEPSYHDKEWLDARYWDDERTQQEIADECGVHVRTIREWMNRHDIETRKPEGEYHGLYGEERDEEVRKQIAETMRGRSVSEAAREKIAEFNRGRTLPESTRRAISQALQGLGKDETTRRRMSESTAGEQNPNWQGSHSERYGAGWRHARQQVRERDEVCQHCGEDGTSMQLDVHHLTPVREYRNDPDLELADAHDPENLLLLCKRCHSFAEHGSITVPPGPTHDAE